MDDPFKLVDEADFQAFIAAYPRELHLDVHHAAEPPWVTYNDFERAPYWPDSVVASKVHGSEGGRILRDLNSPVPDDGKRATDRPTLDANGVELKVGDRVRVHWGWSSKPNTTLWGRTYDVEGNCYQEHTVILNDPGTKYERLGISGCANRIHSPTTWLIDRATVTEETPQ